MLQSFSIYILLIGGTSLTIVKINVNQITNDLQHFWTSTGYCPLDPKTTIYQSILSQEEKLNYALIGSLPNRGITQIRIHWLLNSIKINNQTLDFIYLDKLVSFLTKYDLALTFELMGTPEGFLNNFTNKQLKSKKFWRNISKIIAKRYLDKFGLKTIQRWNFETWNEPDLKNYNVLNFTLFDYLKYVSGCSKGLKEILGDRAILGGPAGTFRDRDHPLCWGLLEFCNKAPDRCPLQYISFHRKGNGTAESLRNGTVQLLDLIHNRFSQLIHLPVANDEADLMVTWSKSWDWLADMRYGAMITKVISDHYTALTLERNQKIQVLSNDNAFLNYHPFYFTQRTLFVRFQMNNTKPQHFQFIRKPIYSTMALLSLLGNKYLRYKTTNSLLTVIPTLEFNKAANEHSMAIICAYGNDTDANSLNQVETVEVKIENFNVIELKLTIYLLDNQVSNPYQEWLKLGSPVFPNKSERKKLRQVEEPFRVTHLKVEQSNKLKFAINVTLPSVVLFHFCSKSNHKPGRVLDVAIFNITRNEVLLTWSGRKINTKCIRTYEVQQESKCENGTRFQRINLKDTIFHSFHYAPNDIKGCEATIGRYKVRAVDYWSRTGRFSKVISYIYS